MDPELKRKNEKWTFSTSPQQKLQERVKALWK
jgi:hypothetical protein